MFQEKLERIEVDPCLVTWISSYLTETPQYVKLKDWAALVHRRAQGPLPFTLYTSDLTTQRCVLFKNVTMIQLSWGVLKEDEYREDE